MGEGNIENNTLEEMTNEEYRNSIIEIVNSIDNEKFLRLIHSLIISAIEKWL